MIDCYYHQAMSKEELSKTVQNLIAEVLSWHEQAKRLGLVVKATDVLKKLKAVQNTVTITLEHVYSDLYELIAETVTAGRSKTAKHIEIRPYRQDAGAFFLLLRTYLHRKGRFKAHTEMLEKKDTYQRSALEVLLYRDESECKEINKAVLNRGNKPNATAEQKEAAVDLLRGASKNNPDNRSQGFSKIWECCYQRGNDEINPVLLAKRRKMEIIDGYNKVLELLDRPPADGYSIEEQAFASNLLAQYGSADMRTPYYNIIRFSAAGYCDLASGNQGVALLHSDLATERAEKICKKLYEIVIFENHDRNALTVQQMILFDDIDTRLDAWSPETRLVSDMPIDDTVSISASVAPGNKAKARSVHSAYTANTSATSSSRSQKESAKMVKDDGFYVMWNAYCDDVTVNVREAKCALKHYSAVSKRDMSNKKQEEKVEFMEKSRAFLHRTFSWLQQLPSKPGVVLGAAGLFGRKEKIYQDMPSKEWKKYVPYMICKKDSLETFIEYCNYQAEQVEAGYQLKTYEIDFIMENIKLIYLRKTVVEDSMLKTNELNVFLNNQEYLELTEELPRLVISLDTAINLVYPVWDKRISRLENLAEKGQLTHEIIDEHVKMLTDDNKNTIHLDTVLGGKNNKTLSERIFALKNSLASSNHKKKMFSFNSKS